MFVLGLQGSPRKKGNTSYLLSEFMREAGVLGAKTQIIHVAKKNIESCRGCGHCERKGFCVIENDDMKSEIYPLIRKADMIVAATPIYFYNASAQLKGLIDRCQALWARKYINKLADPASQTRKGILLSVGATKGENLFEGLALTTKYFFDALDATFCDRLTYKCIEGPGDMAKHETLIDDIKEKTDQHINPFMKRKKILFACRENACRSQMASAFAQYFAGEKIDALRGGSQPAEEINTVMVDVMAEKGIDMAFRTPELLENTIADGKPDIIVTMGCKEECPFIPGVEKIDWDLPDPAGEPIEFMRDVRDEIERSVRNLIEKL